MAMISDQESPLQSPESFIGIAQSHQVSSLEHDETLSTRGGSWRIGMPWFANGSRKSPRVNVAEDSNHEDLRYYGGLMKRDSSLNPNQTSASKLEKFGQESVKDGALPGSKEDDSLGDFDESEWTPQDSAYGAACPVCGCIPKHVRRLIEFSMIAGMAVGFVYLLVTTSIHLSNDRSSASMNGNSTTASDYYGQLALDDDLYVEYNKRNHDDDVYQNDAVANDDTDDDAYANYNDGYGGGRRMWLE